MNYPVKVGTKPTDYADEMKAAFNHGLYKAALMLAVAIPDICAGLEGESGRTDRSKYEKWCDSYLLPIVSGVLPDEFSGRDLYQMRNSLLHNGSFALDRGKLTKFDNIRFSVFDSAIPLIVCQGNWSSSDGKKNEHLAINLSAFVDCVANAVAKFLEIRPDCNRENEKDCPFYSGMVDFTYK